MGNPGPGGYGAILVYQINRKELSGGYRLTTNNRMELMAAIQGLAALKDPCQVRLYSDSKYLVEAMEKGWARRWQAHNWYRNKQEKLQIRTFGKNSSIFAENIRLVSSGSRVITAIRRMSNVINLPLLLLNYQNCPAMRATRNFPWILICYRTILP